MQQQVLQLGEKLEVVTEKYNAATAEFTKAKQAQARATGSAAALAATLEAAQGKVRQMASSLYQSVPFGEFTAMMTSSSPEEFLSQMSDLDMLSAQRSRQLAALRAATLQADAARAEAERATAAAQKVADDLASKKAWIEQQLPKQKALLASLTAQQRQQIFDADGGSATWPAGTSATGAAKVALDAARSKVGSPYVWAAAGPNSFDCSGLTMWAWAQAGVSLPHNSQAQFGVGTPVSRDQLQPGDLVFFYNPIHHVGIYVGDGKMIHAPTSGDVVKISSMSSFPWTGARRVG